MLITNTPSFRTSRVSLTSAIFLIADLQEIQPTQVEPRAIRIRRAYPESETAAAQKRTRTFRVRFDGFDYGRRGLLDGLEFGRDGRPLAREAQEDQNQTQNVSQIRAQNLEEQSPGASAQRISLARVTGASQFKEYKLVLLFQKRQVSLISDVRR